MDAQPGPVSIRARRSTKLRPETGLRISQFCLRGHSNCVLRASAELHLSFLDIHSTILFGGNANRTIAIITMKNTPSSTANAMPVG